MSLIGKCFKIVEDDEELTMQFPEMIPDVEFKVLTMENDGITSVQIKNGPCIHIKERDSWFWCFYCKDTMHQIEEIEELASDQYPERIMNNLYQGVEITRQLEEISGELNFHNSDLVIHAAEYIRYLEAQLKFSDRAF